MTAQEPVDILIKAIKDHLNHSLWLYWEEDIERGRDHWCSGCHGRTYNMRHRDDCSSGKLIKALAKYNERVTAQALLPTGV